MRTAERQDKAPAGKRSSAVLWEGGARSTDRSVSETQRPQSSDAEVRRRDPTHPSHQGENTQVSPPVQKTIETQRPTPRPKRVLRRRTGPAEKSPVFQLTHNTLFPVHNFSTDKGEEDWERKQQSHVYVVRIPR